MAGVVNAGASPRPRAIYSSWIEAGRTPARWPISQISQRACSRSSGAPKTAPRTRSSMAPLRRTAALWNGRNASCHTSAIANLPQPNLGLVHLDHQSVVGRRDAVRQQLHQLGMGRLVGEVREESAPRADLLSDRDGLGNGQVQ